MAAVARTLAATLAYCCRAAAPSTPRRLVRTQATLPPTRDVDGVATLLKDGAKCVVMLGAGASVAAGLPDFRTPGTGLYDTLEISGLPYPEAVFELDFFRTNPQPFYELAKALWPTADSRPTKAHKLVKLLADKDQLVRCYTQNIDSLERAAGVPAEYIVAAHGNFDSATCIATGEKVDAEALRRAIEDGTTDQFNAQQGGLCKADIVFFGEALPDRFWASLREDFDEAELLLVIGTSLEVHPFASLIDLGTMPRALINRDRVGEHQPDVAFPPAMGKLSGGFDFNETAPVPRDVFLQGDADAIVVDLVERAGWEALD